jgi:hypothetical protein
MKTANVFTLLLSTLCFCFLVTTSQAQNVGLSFSYFVPRHGSFSTPISPFSIRGLGFSFSEHVLVQTGASLYRMSGLSVKGTPLNSDQSFVGPNFTLYVPAELVFRFKGARVSLDLKGGGFFFYGFDQQLNTGSIDRAIRSMENWAVANSNFSFQNKPGVGLQGGLELTVSITQQFGISIETNYLAGQSGLPLSGTYTGGSSTLETKAIEYKDAKVDFTGLEFSIGLIFTTTSDGPGAKKRRR